MKAVLTAILLLTSCALSGSVLAQGRPTQLANHRPGKTGLTLEADVGWNADEVDGTNSQVLTATPGLALALTEKLELELHWPVVFLAASGDLDDSTFLSGNPFAAAYLVKRDPRGYLRLGAGVALPVSDLDNSSGELFGFGEGGDLDSIAYAYARSIRGMWDAWLYYPDQFAFVVPVQLEGQSGALLLGVDGAAALLIPTDEMVDDTTDVLLQGAGIAGLRAGVVTAGLRLQAVWSPTSDGNAQLAAVPFIQGDFDTLFVYARFLLNLDEPLGVFAEGADIWGVFVGAGF